MPRFLVYEVWTTSRVVDAEDESTAYAMSEPEPRRDLSLSNWHAVPLNSGDLEAGLPVVGALNYRQLSTEADHDNGPFGPLSR